jgi:hypothetical protein
VTPFAHIAGLPVEETLAMLGPLAAVAGGGCLATLRHHLRRRRR